MKHMEDTQYLDDVMHKYGHHVFAIANAPKNAIYIGRGKNSIFGNPYPMTGEQSREQVCLDYRKWLMNKIQTDENFAEQVKNLHGKNLKCFCSNGTNSRQKGAKWCHGHILLSCADYLYHQT